MDESPAADLLRDRVPCDGVSIGEIADLCGHSGISVTEKVYRHQLRPVLLAGAVAMDRIFRLSHPIGR